MTEGERAQLAAIATLIEGVARAIDAVLMATPPEPSACPHPPETRQDWSTFGHPAFRCAQCGELVEGEGVEVG